MRTPDPRPPSLGSVPLDANRFMIHGALSLSASMILVRGPVEVQDWMSLGSRVGAPVRTPGCISSNATPWCARPAMRPATPPSF